MDLQFLFLSSSSLPKSLKKKEKKKNDRVAKRRNPLFSRTIQKLNNTVSSGVRWELKRIPTGLSICRGNCANGLGGGGGGEMRERKSFLSGERRSVLLLISTRQQISREHEGGRKGDHRIKPDFIAHAKFLWIPPQSLVPRSPRLPRWTKICTGEEKLINNLIQCKNEFLSVGRSERPSSQRGFLFSFFFPPHSLRECSVFDCTK